jgi:hypothetical protein
MPAAPCFFPVIRLISKRISTRAPGFAPAPQPYEGQQAIDACQVNGERLFNPSADAPK